MSLQARITALAQAVAADVKSLAAAVAAHAAAGDPHPQYTTAAEASAAAPVQSVAGRAGAVVLAKEDVGLGNVANTTDAAKPISTATQTALNGKAPLTGAGTSGTWPISITGNAATATKLATARTINGVAFNGTANITVADATKLPLAGGTMTGAISFAAGQVWPTFNQNTTGNAATATNVAWSGVTGKPAVIAAGATAADARAAIGAGTSNLAIGTTAGTALAGDTVVLPEAPSDGKTYGRKDAGWIEVSDTDTLPLSNLAQSGAVTGDSIVWDGTSWAAGQPLPGSWTDAYAFLMDAGNTGSDLEAYLGVSENYFGFTALLARYEWLAVCDTGTATAMFAASSTAMTAVAASSTAMTAVATSATALAAIFVNSGAKSTFKASTALTVAAIPSMTDDTTPSGASAVSTSLSPSSYGAWNALDKSITTAWLTANGSITDQWLSYDFTAPRFVHTARISTQSENGGANARIKDFHIQYSDNNSSWTTVVTGAKANAATSEDFDVIHGGAHRYWRLFAINNRGASYLEVTEFDLTGFILP